jgi:DNA-directed RNA polymerase subunit RPC12/RpoP
MSRKIECLDCGARLSVAEDFAGKRVKCPKCQASILLPTGPAPLMDDELYDLKPRETRKRRKGRREYPWTQIAAVVRAGVVMGLMMLAGLKTLLPLAALALVGLWALTSLVGKARCYAPALAITGSLLVWMGWSIVINKDPSSLIVIAPAIGVMAWLVQRPGIAPAIGLTVVMVLILLMLLAAAADAEVGQETASKVASIVIALMAIAAIWGGWFEERWRYEGEPA